MTIEITTEHIEQIGCPIERAIADQTEFGAHVGERLITLWSQDGDVSEIPITFARALDFIRRRDAGKKVNPFTFRIT